MNRNKKTKNVKTNKNIEYIQLTSNIDASKSLDNKEDINNTTSTKKGNDLFS